MVDYPLDDTIVAISTPIGQGGIGIVRLSGPEALRITQSLFRPATGGHNGRLAPYRLTYGHIVAPDTRRTVDEVLVSYMPAPHSYTREDVTEINAHGGPVPLREVLSLCLCQGARQAREGEFTLRAFLNGRLDLAQAEAVLDIIQAKTDASLRVALDQLGGHLSQQAGQIRQTLLTTHAYLEASIDFPDEAIPPTDIQKPLSEAQERLDDLLKDADRGIIYREGIHVAIVGRPNVGKSSLLNRLLRSDRALVTPVPGTTRDTLEETINLEGIPLVLVDTAGISDTDDTVERMGIERSRRSLQRADLALLVVDGSVPPSAQDLAVAELVASRPVVVVVNKSDLPRADDYATILSNQPHISLSAATGDGLDRLESLLVETILSGETQSSDSPQVSNPRHRDLLRRAHDAVTSALEASQEQGLPVELVAIDVAEAIHLLGEITGETASDELLSTIFSNFCIGK